jgi:hypothetical protein
MFKPYYYSLLLPNELSIIGANCYLNSIFMDTLSNGRTWCWGINYIFCDFILLEKWHLVKGFHFRYWYTWSEIQLGKHSTTVEENTWSGKFINNSLIKIPLRLLSITVVENKHGGNLVNMVKFCFKDYTTGFCSTVVKSLPNILERFNI